MKYSKIAKKKLFFDRILIFDVCNYLEVFFVNRYTILKWNSALTAKFSIFNQIVDTIIYLF